MRDIIYKNLDGCHSYRQIKDVVGSIELKVALTSERISSYSIPAGGGITYNYAAKLVDERIIGLLENLAIEQQLAEKYLSLADGEPVNTGENRKVLHHLMRGRIAGDVVFEGQDLWQFYKSEHERIYDFSQKVHTGQILGSTGKQFKTVIQIGIGGSDLGPRALYLALKNYARSQKNEKLVALFISNIDPDDPNDVLSAIDFETTIFILVSKSGTTQETLANFEFVKCKMMEKEIPGLSPKQHFVVVTSKTSPLSKTDRTFNSFYIDDFIGGRYSSTSAVGALVLSLAFGSGYFQDLLRGAHEADKQALNTDIRKNASMMDALIGLYERNVLGMPATAVLPYSQALVRFPAHLQQLDMESNGKSVNRYGDPISYLTGPIVFGEPGTNGQHSFYQHLHQGTDIIPLQFIGFTQAQSDFDVSSDGTLSQQKLVANLAAQITAFALGKEDLNRNRHFSGDRPTSLLYSSKLTPRALGALLAHFENKVMFQGFLWNINSFDQEGVQLGKALTSQVLAGDSLNPVLSSYIKLLT